LRQAGARYFNLLNPAQIAYVGIQSGAASLFFNNMRVDRTFSVVFASSLIDPPCHFLCMRLQPALCWCS
jgi:hypothetical protein